MKSNEKYKIAKQFSKVAGSAVLLTANVALAGVGAYAAIKLPFEVSFVEWKAIAALFSVASAGIATDNLKDLKKNYVEYDALVSDAIDEICISDIPMNNHSLD